ncbi:FAD/FMN-dependent oxygenase/oxidase [Rhizodiscina lignyota]|uniref:FAD/FMN-dependent oxygenase/oxidase n=1 Tax=Rhizodiscina lignyota TaxID=1504668 RepID=A0A9P4MC50_9PEZI|nr:FAD/FMN-dependent oxygenase/oxidase [Rhizodiscina lignyota]
MADSVSAEKLKAELALRLTAGATISLPASTEFQDCNLRFTDYGRPTYIAAVRPNCEADVVETVKYAREMGIPFAPRAGHHCVTTSMRHLQNGILIDMRPLSSMSFDANRKEVTVGGGTLTLDFVRFLDEHGMEVTVGSCPTTGIIGVAFGAGLGRLQGKYGYLHDNLVSCKLILADGSVVTVSRDADPDLFWGIRGAGHNFCVALEATFRVYPQANDGIHLSWDFEYSLDQCEPVLETVNTVHETMPADLAIFIVWVRRNKSGQKHLILVNIVSSGKEAEAAPWIKRFSNLTPVTASATRATWSELPWVTYGGMNKVLSKPEVWSQAPYKMMGAVNVEKFDVATTKAFFERVAAMQEAWEGRGLFGAMFECLPHQQVRAIAADETAYPWRWGSNHFLMMTATPFSLSDREAFENHLDEWKAKFTEVSGYGRLQQYVNYGNSTSTKQDPPEALYGYEPWRLEKLRALKRKYDPTNVFRWYQPLIE